MLDMTDCIGLIRKLAQIFSHDSCKLDSCKLEELSKNWTVIHWIPDKLADSCVSDTTRKHRVISVGRKKCWTIDSVP